MDSAIFITSTHAKANVILHVFHGMTVRLLEVRRADGQLVPQVALKHFLPRPLAAYQADIVLDDYPHKTAHVHGRCHEMLQQLAPQEVCEILDKLATPACSSGCGVGRVAREKSA